MNSALEKMASLIRRDIATTGVRGGLCGRRAACGRAGLVPAGAGERSSSRCGLWQHGEGTAAVSFAFLKTKFEFTYSERYTSYVFSALNFGDCMHLCNYRQNEVQNVSIT